MEYVLLCPSSVVLPSLSHVVVVEDVVEQVFDVVPGTADTRRIRTGPATRVVDSTGASTTLSMISSAMSLLSSPSDSDKVKYRGPVMLQGWYTAAAGPVPRRPLPGFQALVALAVSAVVVFADAGAALALALASAFFFL